MDIFCFKTIDRLPALYHEESDLLVLSDIHLGLEATMTRDGNYVPKHQLADIIDDIEKAKEETGAERILVNGDLKNEFKTRFSETAEIEDFLEFLNIEFRESIIVKGNHDTFVEETVNRFELDLYEHHIENGILYTHGDKSLDDIEVTGYETVVIGHEHPALALSDDIGVTEKLDCFLYGKNKDGLKIIVLPAFSTISRGTNVNNTPRRELLSPVLKESIDFKGMNAIGVSREAGLFEFPEIQKI
ncbi:MAG: metallophosphoesterase [Candidatus Nanohaloarchaea archaeon]